MSTPTVPLINFGAGVSWGGYSQPEMLRWAQSPEISPMATRVLFAAMGRVGRTGHAQFRPGELAMLLGRVDTATGEIGPARKSAVSDAIAMARRLGFVDEVSNARCLVLRSYAFQMYKGSTKPCTTHGF